MAWALWNSARYSCMEGTGVASISHGSPGKSESCNEMVCGDVGFLVVDHQGQLADGQCSTPRWPQCLIRVPAQRLWSAAQPWRSSAAAGEREDLLYSSYDHSWPTFTISHPLPPTLPTWRDLSCLHTCTFYVFQPIRLFPAYKELETPLYFVPFLYQLYVLFFIAENVQQSDNQ